MKISVSVLVMVAACGAKPAPEPAKPAKPTEPARPTAVAEKPAERLPGLDKRLIEAAYDAGATGWQTLVNIVIPLSKPGIVIGSIFVITMVMGDYVTIGVMGGQQIASVGKVIQVQLSYLQFPLAAANAVVLLAVVLMVIAAMTRLVDVRKEL